MKKPIIIVGVILGLAVVSWVLILIARGQSYELSFVDPVLGSEDAPVLIEEFSDFQCPACAASAPIVKEALTNYPTQVKFVYKDFPLASIHPQARPAAIGVLCAAQQGKFEEFHDSIFENQADWTTGGGNIQDYMSNLVDENEINRQEWEACISSRDAKKAVDANFDEGRSRGVNSTPTFFVNGTQITPPQSVFQWIQAIDKALEEKGIEPENRSMNDELKAENIVE